MSWICRAVQNHYLKSVIDASQLPWSISSRSKFTKSRIPKEVFEARPEDHEKYGGDPEHPHQLHLVTRVKSTKRRPYWEKKIVEDLGLGKAQQTCVHKNIPSVNDRLKIIKHLVKIQPLKLPHGLPSEEDVADTFLKSNGELVIRRRLKPLDQKAIES